MNFIYQILLTCFVVFVFVGYVAMDSLKTREQYYNYMKNASDTKNQRLQDLVIDPDTFYQNIRKWEPSVFKDSFQYPNHTPDRFGSTLSNFSQPQVNDDMEYFINASHLFMNE